MSNFLPHAVRPSAVLTTSYVAGTVIDNSQSFNQCDINVAFTKGSLTSLEIKVEISVDGTNYYREANVAVSGGTSTLTLNEYTTTTAGNFTIKVPVSCRYIKISAKGTGTVTGSLCKVDAILHVV